MALTFIGLPQGKDGSRSSTTPLFADTLRWFNSALEARDLEVHKLRERLASRIRALRAAISARVLKKVERALADVVSSVNVQFQELDKKSLIQAQDLATSALIEFLDSPSLEPILKQRLQDQVAKLYQQLPNRFTQLYMNPGQSVPDFGEIEVLTDPHIAIGCARLVGRSGAIVLDWKAALKGGKR